MDPNDSGTGTTADQNLSKKKKKELRYVWMCIGEKKDTNELSHLLRLKSVKK